MRKRLLFIALGLFLTTSVYAANQLERYVFDDFSKGLNTKKSPYSLDKSQGTIVENCRFSDELKSLTKRDGLLLYGTADASEAITGMHRLYLKDLTTKVLLVTHGDEIEKGNDDTGAFTTILALTTGDYRWTWLTWNNIAIGTDGYNQPVKYDGSSAAATYLGSCLATDAGSGTGLTGTAYKYKLSYYTASYEVIWDVPSNAVTMTGNDMSLSMIPIAPDTYGGEDVVGRKVYRNKTGGSTYYLLSNGTIANNTAVTLTDSDADADLTATTYPAGNSQYTPPKGKLCLVAKNRLWIANNPSFPSRVYYSEDASPDTFVTDKYFDIRPDDGDQVTFLLNLLGTIIVAKDNSIQKLYTDGSDPAADWSISEPFSFVGCRAMYSAVNTPLGIVYLAVDGLYKFNGQSSSLISDAVTPEIFDIASSNFQNCCAIFSQNMYYLSYASVKSGQSINNRVLMYDLLADAYNIDILSLNNFCTFNSGSDWGILYAGSSIDGKVYSYTGGVNETLSKTHADFTGTWDDMRYIPTTMGGDADSPVLELAWDCDIDGWLVECQAHNNSISTINDINTYLTNAVIDRPDLDGSYISQVYDLQGIQSFDKLYWNEMIPATGGDVTFAIRTADSASLCAAATFSTAFSTPSGSDISSVGAKRYVQYNISMTTVNSSYTPTIYKTNGYDVKLTYNKTGNEAETAIQLQWESGLLDLGQPGVTKALQKIEVFYDAPENTGTMDLKFSALEYNSSIKSYEETSDTFTISLTSNPKYYVEYFTTGKFVGEFFKLNIKENSLKDLVIKKIVLWYNNDSMY